MHTFDQFNYSIFSDANLPTLPKIALVNL